MRFPTRRAKTSLDSGRNVAISLTVTWFFNIKNDVARKPVEKTEELVNFKAQNDSALNRVFCYYEL